MSDLAEFLLARIAEDEAAAHAAEAGPWIVGTTTEPIWAPGHGEHWGVTTNEGTFPQTQITRGTHIASKSGQPRVVADMARGYLHSRHEPTADHIVRHDPPRVLAQCVAKRLLIVDIVTNYLDHPGGVESTDGLAERVLARLALPYADHPDYRDEWKP